jgi:LysM repeat protein
VIASRYGTTWQRIAQDNGITNPDFIKPGQQLTIKK